MASQPTLAHALGLPAHPGLEHRGGLNAAPESLYPPPGTFAALGGREGVARLVHGLYDRIEADPLLRSAFNRDLTHERENQAEFFAGWFGGPSRYFDAAWRPGLHHKHARLSISRGVAERWLAHFLAAFGEVSADSALLARVEPAVRSLALALVNRDTEPAPGEALRLRCSGVEMQAFSRLVQKDDAEGFAAAVAAHPHGLERHGPALLLLAAVRGKSRAAAELLRHSVNANTPAPLAGGEASLQGLPALYLTPLCGALAKGRAEAARLLADHGARYDVFTAACLGDLNALEQLLETAPALANACDPACDLARITPLVHAVFAGQLEAARLLLRRGAEVGAHSVRLVHAAVNRGDEALTDLLLEHGADPSPLGAGAWVLYPAIAEKLLSRGAEVNRDPGAWIGMCCTGNSGHKENEPLARALLECGADVHARYGGRTALHCAAKAGFARIVAALLEHGADVNARDDDGRTPLDVLDTAAKSIDREPVRRLLRAHGAR